LVKYKIGAVHQIAKGISFHNLPITMETIIVEDQVAQTITFPSIKILVKINLTILGRRGPIVIQMAVK
jgi:hypothetical protein